MSEDKQLQDIYELLQQKGASETQPSQIRIWKYQDLFPQRNDFKKLQLIGRGNGANVYLQIINGLKYAVKVMTQGRSKQKQDLINEFYQVIYSLSTFRDERILNLVGVAIDQTDEDDLIFCVFTNHMTKGNLKSAIQSQLIFQETDTNQKMLSKLKMILQIVEGVVVIHNANQVHKNLKTQNILLDENDCPKLGCMKSQEYV